MRVFVRSDINFRKSNVYPKCCEMIQCLGGAVVLGDRQIKNRNSKFTTIGNTDKHMIGSNTIGSICCSHQPRNRQS